MSHPRLATAQLQQLAAAFPAVAILGARQVGKTTLAKAAFPDLAYVDLEQPRMRELFSEDVEFAIRSRAGIGIVLDEAQCVPSVFTALRGLIDADRGARGKFVLLGSAQPTLIRGIAESLAGRVAIVDLDPLCAAEATSGDQPVPWQEVWLRGGYPDALHGDFRQWHEAYLRLYIERDLPQYGVAADPVFARRLLTMLAHQQGGVLQVTTLCNALDASHHRVTRLLDAFEQTFVVRRLQPWHASVGKRLVKAPKLYLRDTGLLHHLLGIGSHAELLNHPARGASWETFVVEDLLRRHRLRWPHAQPHYWRTSAGAEVDLVFDHGDRRTAVECKAGVGDARAARHLGDTLADIGAATGTIVDNGPAEEWLNPRVCRRAFACDLRWLPS